MQTNNFSIIKFVYKIYSMEKVFLCHYKKNPMTIYERFFHFSVAFIVSLLKAKKSPQTTKTERFKSVFNLFSHFFFGN